jgi:uncharacterized protein
LVDYKDYGRDYGHFSASFNNLLLKEKSKGSEMLSNTFSHIPGVTQAIERKIRACGINSWQDFIDNHGSLKLENKEQILYRINESINQLREGNYGYFKDSLSKSLWKFYGDFPCCFLDIETTGLSREWHDITLIGLYDGTESKVFIKGQNMHEFPSEIAKYGIIVTYNGSCFDLPFILNKFPGLCLDQIHLDLRYIMRSIGYTGGLKSVEKQIGICREDDVASVNGFEAVRLWKRYQKGDKAALALLVKYNIADIENLKVMMEFAVERLKV